MLVFTNIRIVDHINFGMLRLNLACLRWVIAESENQPEEQFLDKRIKYP